MIVHDDVFSWNGFGGLFQLASGCCRLRIFDLSKGGHKNVAHIKPIVAVASELPDSSPKMKKISVRSCSSHIATCLVNQFKIDPHRMIFAEYTPKSTYGDRQQFTIAAKLEMVDFQWHDQKALYPKFRDLPEPLNAIILDALADN
ncbi:MAG: hypothetical protein GY874_19480 [Desulfobacteraceae bacterium]|nr:hypothetical protein [Desulfobacteraceae bacterium]